MRCLTLFMISRLQLAGKASYHITKRCCGSVFKTTSCLKLGD